ncbi:uncharacterized protein LOC104929912 isoform X8 [Scomber scombrus]|uniref:Uncharacterized protein LOC104929912 isoform X8 n=1 Tax=Scomber scombrus TaxID=13677 RepID=A0AAV1NYC6_SCOSC
MERFKRRLDILKIHHKKCEASYAASANTQMAMPIEMDSSTLSGSISDQPPSTREHDGLLVEESKSLCAALNSSTADHEIPPLKAQTSKSELSKMMPISCQGGSDKKNLPSSDTHDEDAELFSNNGSGEEYQPSSTPSSSDDEAPSEKVELSRHRVAEKDHCRLSSSENEELEAADQRTKAKSPHPPERLKGGKKQQGGDKRQKVTVNTSQKNGERTRGKAQYCVYCGKSNLKIARHLQRKHEDEVDVAHAFSFPVGSKERKVLLETLRNKGNWQHNLKVFKEGNGEIVTWKRPSKKASVNDYLPCQHCYAMFKRTDLWRHKKTCRVRKGEIKKGKRGRVQKASSQLLPIRESSDGIQNLIHTMLQDKVTSQIRSDTMICKYGDALFAKKGREQSQHRYIAQKMRELGRFVLAAKEIDKSVKGLKDLCDPTKFDLTIKAARRVSNYSTSTTEYGKPSTAVKIGFSLKSATEAWIGHCLMTSDVLGENKAKKFKELLDNSWSCYVSTNAHSTMEQRRWNKEDCVPLTEDVITLQNYLRKIEDESKAELKKCVSTTAYKRLCESLLAQIIVFNKKREGEASRLTLETYLKADTGPVNKDIYDTLSPVEKQMSHRLTRIVTRVQSLKGKSLKTLDSVVFDKRHETHPTTGSRSGKERQTSVADRPLEANDDGDQQHLSTTSLPVERQKKTAKRRHDDTAGSESDVDEEEQQQTPKRPPVDWSDDEGLPPSGIVNTRNGLSQSEEEQSVTATKASAKRGKKTTTKRGKTDARIQVKRPWTDQEKIVVQRRMTKFIALKKVPGKNDCMLCIGKESPVLSTRTWKDIKYFVYNEIIKAKRKLAF